MAASEPLTADTQPAFERKDAGLALLVLMAWSLSWIGVHLQVGTVAPEVSVAWRFLIAGAFMIGICLVRGESLRGYSWRDHALLALLGPTLFSLNFVFFYYGGLTIVSGMLAVVFALAAPLNAVMQALLLKRPLPPVAVLGSIVGVAGVGTLFAPEIIESGFGHAAGLVLALIGTVFFCTGNYVSAKIQERGLPLAPATAYGMLYGAAFIAGVAVLRGQSFEVEWTAAYLGSLVFLALVSSVVAFLAYLGLLRRIGPARAGYVTVVLPVFALVVSTFYEGYQWTLWSIAGMALVALGNVLVLRRKPAATH